jgi:hypothetical protein
LSSEAFAYALGITWIVATVIGLFVTTLNFRDAFLDNEFVNHHKIGNGRKVLSRVSVVNEGTRLLVNILFLASAIWLHLWRYPDNFATVSIFVRFCIVLTIMLTTVQSILLRYARIELSYTGVDVDDKSLEGETP